MAVASVSLHLSFVAVISTPRLWIRQELDLVTGPDALSRKRGNNPRTETRYPMTRSDNHTFEAKNELQLARGRSCGVNNDGAKAVTGVVSLVEIMQELRLA
jgi:hypothetical protein